MALLSHIEFHLLKISGLRRLDVAALQERSACGVDGGLLCRTHLCTTTRVLAAQVLRGSLKVSRCCRRLRHIRTEGAACDDPRGVDLHSARSQLVRGVLIALYHETARLRKLIALQQLALSTACAPTRLPHHLLEERCRLCLVGAFVCGCRLGI